MKKIITILLLSSALFASCEKRPSEKGPSENDFFIDTNRTITAYTGKAKEVIIPDQINGIPVKAIGIGAFSFKDITSVSLPDGLASIGEDAFSHNQLTSITIPDSVWNIGRSAFFRNRLSSVVISNASMRIGKYAFCDNQLTSITIPDGTMSIGDWVFAYNYLTSLDLPDSIVRIGEGAFSDNKLESFTISENLKSIGSDAFWKNRLESITIPSHVTIGDSAFAINSLRSISLPHGMTAIGNGVFHHNQLKSVIIPDSVTNIGISAFEDNHQLLSITIGADVEFADKRYPSINRDFDVCYNNNKKKAGLYIYDGVQWDLINEKDFEIDEKGTIIAYNGQKASVFIPEKIRGVPVKAIERGTFMNRGLTRVNLPVGLVFIGADAFRGNQLISVTIPEGVKNIGVSAFENNELTNVTIPDGVFVDYAAFSGNDDMRVFMLGADIRFQTGINDYPAYYEYLNNDRKAGTYMNQNDKQDRR